MASRYTTRFGRSLRDFERAVELNTICILAEKFDEAVKVARELAQRSIEMREPDFTLDQLIERVSLTFGDY